MLPGVNYPWTVVDGRPNYGCDFGLNVWGSHAGVAARVGDVRSDLERMAAMGAEVVRWFVFTDGRAGIRWSGDGAVDGLADGVVDDLDEALEMAIAARVRLCLVLFDFLWMAERAWSRETGVRPKSGCLGTMEGAARVVERIVDPLLDRYGRGGAREGLGAAVHSVDVINEPDWVTRGLAWTPDRLTPAGRVVSPFGLAELRRFVSGVSGRIHARSSWLVTVGGARVRHAGEWDRPEYGLDFVQIHLYARRWKPWRDRTLIGRPARALALSKPVLIGEFPANGDARHPPDHRPPRFSRDDYLAMAREGGYLGAWPWSFKGIDDFGAVPDAARLD